MNITKREKFLGTYFDKDVVMRFAMILKILAWIILIIFGFQLIFSIIANILQILRGFWIGMALTDMVQNFLYLFVQPLQGVVYFCILVGFSHLLLIFLDIEDNTRRSARRAKDQ